jgi:hypothetical protein
MKIQIKGLRLEVDTECIFQEERIEETSLEHTNCVPKIVNNLLSILGVKI